MPNLRTNAHRSKAIWIYLLGLACLLCFAVAPLSAQFDTGAISGSVVDPSGAAIPRATVTAMNLGTK